MVHVIRRTGDTRILSPTLPNQLEQVVDTGQDIVHEDDRVKDFSVIVTKFVEGQHGGVSDFGKVFDTVVEQASGTHRCSDDDPQADGSREGIENLQERLCLVVGPVFVDGDKDVVVAQDGSRSEECRKEVGDDVKRVVQVDREKVLVLPRLQIPLDVVQPVVSSGRRHGRLGITLAAKQSAQPARVGPRFLVPDKRRVPFLDLLDVERLRVAETLLGVVGGEGADELEDMETLLDGGEHDLGAL